MIIAQLSTTSKVTLWDNSNGFTININDCELTMTFDYISTPAGDAWAIERLVAVFSPEDKLEQALTLYRMVKLTHWYLGT